ncbi:response regulator [Saccharopolyspora cebuensis]|uniref:Transcriptional regulatory protein n=1 Tax=Saccharopolyspora cebuensis TaxID=418759 RepID=A0ABV4CEQ8_9PSEU
MIRVLVVEDDFRVAQVHAEFTDGVAGFRTVGIAHSAAEARDLVAQRAPELVLLDNYLPDGPGVALLAGLEVDTIMLTAASDPATVRAALAAGALNYLVKPFSAEQLAARLTAYARFRARLPEDGGQVGQEEIDRAMRLLHEGDQPGNPKGQSTITTQLVVDALHAADRPRSATEIAEALGIARATAQRYLAGLARDGRAVVSLRYGASGRPEHQYEPVDPPRR